MIHGVKGLNFEGYSARSWVVLLLLALDYWIEVDQLLKLTVPAGTSVAGFGIMVSTPHQASESADRVVKPEKRKKPHMFQEDPW